MPNTRITGLCAETRGVQNNLASFNLPSRLKKAISRRIDLKYYCSIHWLCFLPTPFILRLIQFIHSVQCSIYEENVLLKLPHSEMNYQKWNYFTQKWRESCPTLDIHYQQKNFLTIVFNTIIFNLVWKRRQTINCIFKYQNTYHCLTKYTRAQISLLCGATL